MYVKIRDDFKNHGGTIISVKLQSVTFAKITVVHRDSTRTVNPNMHGVYKNNMQGKGS